MLEKKMVHFKIPVVKTFKNGVFVNLNCFLIDHNSPIFSEGKSFMEVVTAQLLFPLTNN